jgi:hypothetical protein
MPLIAAAAPSCGATGAAVAASRIFRLRMSFSENRATLFPDLR